MPLIPWRKLQAGLAGKGGPKGAAFVLQHAANEAITKLITDKAPTPFQWEIAGSSPALYFSETDQTDPAGRWRIRAQGDYLYFERSGTAKWGGSDTSYLQFRGAGTDPWHFTEVVTTQTNPTVARINNFAATATASQTSGNNATTSIRTIGAQAVLGAANTGNWTATDIVQIPLRAFHGEVAFLAGAAGTVTGAAGLLITAKIDAATLTNLYGIYVADISAGSGTITNQYGLYIAQPTGGATLNRAIYVAGGRVDFIQGATAVSAFHIGTSSILGGWVTSVSDSGLVLTGGCEWNGTAWLARATVASQVQLDSGGIYFYTNTGLTAGNTFTATLRGGFVSGYYEMPEISDPAAPAANNCRLYTKDNGSNKTQLVAIFPTGAVQVIATEP